MVDGLGNGLEQIGENSLAANSVGTTEIINLSVKNEDVSATAGITSGKLAVTSGSLIRGSAGGVGEELAKGTANQILAMDGAAGFPGYYSVSGDVTQNTGTFSVVGIQTGAACLRVSDDDAGADLVIQQDSASPAPSDTVGNLIFQGRDDGAGLTPYSQISGTITDTTAGAEFGEVEISVQNGTGALATTATFSHDGANGTIATDLVVGDGNAGITGANVTAVEYGDGFNHTTVLTLTAADISAGLLVGAGNIICGGLIYTFPAGAHLHSVTAGNIAFTGDAGIQGDTPDFGIGSVIGTGAFAVLGGTATFEDYVNGSAAADCNGTPNPIAMVGATAGLHTGISFNATTDAKTVHLNAAANWSAASVALLVSGNIVLKWSTMG